MLSVMEAFWISFVHVCFLKGHDELSDLATVASLGWEGLAQKTTAPVDVWTVEGGSVDVGVRRT